MVKTQIRCIKVERYNISLTSISFLCYCNLDGDLKSKWKIYFAITLFYNRSIIVVSLDGIFLVDIQEAKSVISAGRLTYHLCTLDSIID